MSTKNEYEYHYYLGREGGNLRGVYLKIWTNSTKTISMAQ